MKFRFQFSYLFSSSTGRGRAGDGGVQKDFYRALAQEAALQEGPRAGLESSQGTRNHSQEFGGSLNRFKCKLL